MKNLKRTFLALVIGSAVAGTAQAQTVAFTPTDGIGNQGGYSGSLGLEFNVLSPIFVTQLGAYDSDSNNFPSNTIIVQIYNRNTQTLVAGFQRAFSGTTVATAGFDGPGFSNYSDLGLVLGVGQYVAVASGYGGTEENGNVNIGDPAPTLNTGGGLVSFGNSRYNVSGAAGYPADPDPTAGIRYYGPTFRFVSVAAIPEPSTVALLGAGLGVAALAYRRRRKA